MRDPNAKMASFQYAIQQLSISEGCQMDVVGFISRCPHLKVLTIEPEGFTIDRLYHHEEQKRMKSLGNFLNSGALHHLEHLDIVLSSKHDIMFPTCIPCLRSFTAPEIGPLSLPGFRTHFSTISKIDTIGPPGFWREVLASCPALVTARNVYLSQDDIVNGVPWVCTVLKDLQLEFGARSDILNHGGVEDALIRRISKLGKLNHLGLDSAPRHANESNGKGLGSGSWELLSKMTQLTSLNLGRRHCPVLDQTTFAQISGLEGLKILNGNWRNSREAKNLTEEFRKRGIKVHWY